MSRKRISALLCATVVLLAPLWLTAVPAFAAGNLTNVSNTPTSAVAGATTTHVVAFTTASSLPGNSKIEIDFPAGFNVSAATLGTITGPSGPFSLSVAGQTILIIRDGTAPSFAPGPVSITLNNITNTQISGSNYKVTVTTATTGDVIIDGPTDSALFAIVPGAIHHYSVSSISSPQAAGTPFNVTIQAQDVYNNNITTGADAAETVNLTFAQADSGATPTSVTTVNGAATASVTMTVAQGGQAITFTGATSGKSGTSGGFTVSPGAIHHYSVSSISSPQVAGTPFNVTIQAQDVYNNNITSGTDAAETVNLTFAQADGGATPTSVTTVNGAATASVTTTVAQGGQAITFTGATSGKTGTSGVFTVNPGAIHHYSVSSVSSPQVAGTPFNVTIQAQDSCNNDITTGAGATETVNLTFAQADGGATPASVTTVNGAATASVMMTVVRSGQAVIFTGATSGKTGTSNAFNVLAANSLTNVSNTPTSAVAGATTTHTIAFTTASNLPGNSKIEIDFPTGFNVSAATLGAVTGPTGPFTLSVAGQAIFITRNAGAVFAPGAVSITINNITNTQISGSNYKVTITTATTGGAIIDGPTDSASFAIIPTAIHHYAVSNISSPQAASTPFNVTIQAQDVYNNNITSGADAAETVNLTFAQADGGATPTSVTTVNGAATVSMTMTVPQGGQAITFTGATSGKTGTSGVFTVNPGAIHHYSVSSISSPQAAGTPFNVTIQAQDVCNNDITSGADAAETVNLTFAQTDGGATPTSVTTVNGAATASVTMTVPQGGQAITFTGTTSGKTGTSGVFTVGPAAVHHYSVSSISSPQVAGTAFSVTIQAQDINNNNITTGTGATETVNLTFAQADSGATPTSVTTANGAATASVTMTVARSGQTITFTGATSGKSGTSGSFTVSPGAIHHYSVSSISSLKVVNTYFSVTIQAQDAYNNNITTGTGAAETVNLTFAKTDSSATPTSVTTVSGAATASVKMTVCQSGQAIIFTGATSGKSGISNSFDVISSSYLCTLNTYASPSGGGSVYPYSAQYTYGTSVTLTATPASGHTFAYWSGDASGYSTTTTITMDSDKTVVAVFTPSTYYPYSLNVYTSPSGGGSVYPYSGNYAYGTSVTLTATPASGYTFAYWSGDASGYSTTTTITMTSSKSVTAHFTSATNITAVSNTPASTVAGATTTHTVAFTTASNLPGYSKIQIDFPYGFDLTAATLGAVSGPYGTFSLSVVGQSIYITSITGYSYSPGPVTIAINNIINTPTAGSNYKVTVTTKTSGGVIIDGPTDSALFTITSGGGIHHYSISSISSSQVAGTPFSVTIQAQDIYNNNITSTTETVRLTFAQTDSGATPTSITAVNGAATVSVTMTVARSGQSITFTGTTSGKSGTSNSFEVTAGVPTTPTVTPNITSVAGKVNSSGVFTSQAVAPSADNNVTVTIDVGTKGLDTSGAPLTQITVAQRVNPPAPPADTIAIGLVYDISPDGATFDRPITITIKYNPYNLPLGINESTLYIAWYDVGAGKWTGLPSTVDSVNNSVSAEVNHLSNYVVLAPSGPAGFVISNLTTNPEEVEAGEEVTISATVTNNSDSTGSYDVALKINEQLIDTTKVTLAGHQSKAVAFTISQETAGTYNVSIGSLKSSFVVTAPVTPEPKPEPTKPAPPSKGVNATLIAYLVVIIIVVILCVWKYLSKRKTTRKSQVN